MAIAFESITPSAGQATDRITVRRGAGPADHTMELLTPASLKTLLSITTADVSGLATVATSGSASDLTAGTLPAARFDDTAHGARAGGTLHANAVAAGAAGFMTGADKTKLDGIAAGAQVNVPTDLAYTAASRLLASSTGADVTLPLVVAAGDAGLMTGADKTKLDGIAAGAQVNVPTDLAYTASTRLLASSTGADVNLPLVTSTDAGLAPLSGGGTTNFLRADGTWAAPGGGGSTNLSWTASTRTVASDTGTDAVITLFNSTDPGLTPLSGGGTTNFLRADGTWAAPGGGAAITVQDEGSNITTALGTLNFVGAGVTVTGGATAVVTIPGGSVSDGDKGDITVSASGATWRVDPNIKFGLPLAMRRSFQF